MPTDLEEQVPEQERQGASVTNFPEQTIYTFATTRRILGVHVTTLHKRARDGKLKTVNTPVGRRTAMKSAANAGNPTKTKPAHSSNSRERDHQTAPAARALALGKPEATRPRLRGNEGHGDKT